MIKNIKKSASTLSLVLILLACSIRANAQLIINMNEVDIWTRFILVSQFTA